MTTKMSNNSIGPDIFLVKEEFDENGKELRNWNAKGLNLADDVLWVDCENRANSIIHGSCKNCMFGRMNKWLFYDEYVAGYKWKTNRQIVIPAERTKNHKNPTDYWEKVLNGPLNACWNYIKMCYSFENEWIKSHVPINLGWHCASVEYINGKPESDFIAIEFSREPSHSTVIDIEYDEDNLDLPLILKEKYERSFDYRQTCVIKIPHHIFVKNDCKFVNFFSPNGVAEDEEPAMSGLDYDFYSEFEFTRTRTSEKWAWESIHYFFITLTVSDMKIFTACLEASRYAKDIKFQVSELDKKLNCYPERFHLLTYSADSVLIDSDDYCVGAAIRWKFNHELILNACIALAQVFPPVYVMLEILDWFDCVEMQSHVRKIRLIESIYRSIRKIREKREQRQNGAVALRTRRQFQLHSINDPQL